jgi:exosortase/archaeosortase family protein
LGSLLVAAALYSHYMGGHSALLIELIMVGVGTSIGIHACWSLQRRESKESEGILIDLLSRYMRRELCAYIIPVAGFALILSWSIWKMVFIGETNLRMEDFIVTLLALSLVVYPSGKSKLGEVKDFVVLYLLLLAIVFVILWRTYSLVTGESHYRITSYAEHYFIALPVSWLLEVFGFNVNAILDLDGIGMSNIIEYEHDGLLQRVGIGVGCSGLYSAGLFFSAFLAFVIARYRRMDAYTSVGLLVGFVTTWMSNIIRMVITVMAGIAWGPRALVAVHSFIGILIFVGFLSVFWIIIVRWLDSKEQKPESDGAHTADGSVSEA